MKYTFYLPMLAEDLSPAPRTRRYYWTTTNEVINTNETFEKLKIKIHNRIEESRKRLTLHINALNISREEKTYLKKHMPKKIRVLQHHLVG